MPRSRMVLWTRAVRGRLNRILRSGRSKSAATDPRARRSQERLAKRLENVEKRLTHLESMIEGLQDSVHRESVRQGEKIDQLQRNAEPSAIRRALSRDAQEHGL
jgi:hypothetical protein